MKYHRYLYIIVFSKFFNFVSIHHTINIMHVDCRFIEALTKFG